MSNIYIQEPPTNGKVLLITSAGDIDVELWSKEAPKACRNFVQLCMEGYYDGTVFHRVVKDFIVQGGDPTGTGEGGESIYGAPFKDEFHSRLRFVRRGLVAMANAGQNDNGSQFFFTMGPTQELQNKHTIFGKVTGNTVYNMLKLQDVEVDENERPTGPHKIKSTHILSIPFDDIVPRTKKKEHTEGEKKVKSKSKATKNFKLLSFGEEAEEDEEEVAIASKDMKGKSKSSHDLTDDPSLSSVQAVDDGPSPKRTKLTSEDEEEMDKEYDDKMKERVRQKLKQDNTTSQKSEIKEKETKDETSKLSRSEELRQEAKRLKKELKGNNKIKTESPKDEQKEKAPINDVMASYIADKQKYKEARKNIKKGPDREAMTLALLSKFQSKLSSVKRLAGDYSDDNDEEDEEKEKEMEEDTESDLSWMRHKLHFEDHSKKVLDANVHDVDRYEIYDPRNPLTKRRRENDKKTAKK